MRQLSSSRSNTIVPSTQYLVLSTRYLVVLLFCLRSSVAAEPSVPQGLADSPGSLLSAIGNALNGDSIAREKRKQAAEGKKIAAGSRLQRELSAIALCRVGIFSTGVRARCEIFRGVG